MVPSYTWANHGSALISIAFDSLATTDLVVDAIYESNRATIGGALSGEPLSKLMGVGNMGGIRAKSGKSGIMAVVLTSSGEQPEWPDSLDTLSGTYTYFGDNRTPGLEMHKTPQRGNALLRDAFEFAHGGTPEMRKRCPVFFIFESAGRARDFVFRGMAVPGSEFLAPGEDLTAVWRRSNGVRFQNYRASLTVLNEPRINGEWLRESISSGEFLITDDRAPKTLRHWIQTGNLTPLMAEQVGTRSKADQGPKSKSQLKILETILNRCQFDPWQFETIAAEIWKLSCTAPVSYELTRRFRDGGRDAIGHMEIGPYADPIRLSFALEAKLYSLDNFVGVKELSRLISRIKHREFGVFVTTSAVSSQAYREVREDGHPIVIISGRDICEVLAGAGISSELDCTTWLESKLST